MGLKLSDQFAGCIMLILTDSLMRQKDALPMLKELEVEMRDGELFVLNPPTIKPLSEEELSSLEQEVKFVGTED